MSMPEDAYIPHPPIFVIGYMACGKTTFGRALAKATGKEFVDLDFRIEQRYHATIPEIFRIHGEDEFRRMEASLLREVGEMENVVVACGGGTPCFNGNMDFMTAAGTTLWLEASPERITERLIRNRSRRPLMADKRDDEILESVREGLEARHRFYARCTLRYNGDLLENRYQIQSTIAAFLAENPDI